MGDEQQGFPCLRSLTIEGYRPFGSFSATLSRLEVIVGANGAGKSSLFEFLMFLRDAVQQDISPEIIAGSKGRELFHRPGEDVFRWHLNLTLAGPGILAYEGSVEGPLWRAVVPYERLWRLQDANSETDADFMLMEMRQGNGPARDRDNGAIVSMMVRQRRPSQLALGLMTDPSFATSHGLREFVIGWRFYSAFNINPANIRRSVPVEQNPILHEDGGNLSSVLFHLMTEHPLIFDELKTHMRSAVPGFRNLTVKARGGPGEVIAFWQEQGVDTELSLADLSDGILRFLCWAVLCLTPTPPTLVCIDEPDQGVHPRTLPVLAGLFKKASHRTQILLATHASYFLTQFDISRIAVMKKVDGESRYLKPADSAALRANLEEFGSAELEAMHRSDEFEALL